MSAQPESLPIRLDRFRAQYALQHLHVNQADWAYYRCGQADQPALLLLPGGGGDAASMFPYVEAFADYYQVLVPEIPPSIHTTTDSAAGLYALLEQENISQVMLVGISFGALLAQVFVRRFPQMVQHLVLSHAMVPAAHHADPLAMRRGMLTLYPAPLLGWISRRSYRTAFQNSRTPANPENRVFWQNYFDTLYRSGSSKRQMLSRVRIALDYHRGGEFSTRDLAGWTGSMLLIESSHDEVISEGDRGAVQAVYPQAYLQILEGCDHLAPLLAADDLAQSILKFLSEHGESA